MAQIMNQSKKYTSLEISQTTHSVYKEYCYVISVIIKHFI
jgi:hypothetical protein